MKAQKLWQELHRKGFHDWAAAWKPHRTKSSSKRQMQWCKAHKHLTVKQWKLVISSDKSHFSIWQSGEWVWVWRMLDNCLTAQGLMEPGWWYGAVFQCLDRALYLQGRTALCVNISRHFGQCYSFNFVGIFLGRFLHIPAWLCKARIIKTWNDEFSLEEGAGLHGALTSNPLSTLGWTGTEIVSQAFSTEMLYQTNGHKFPQK